MVVGHILSFTQIVLLELFVFDSFLDRSDDLRAFFRMRLHDRIFLVGELAGLVEDDIRYFDLADIMHRRGGYYIVLVFFIDHISVNAVFDHLLTYDADIFGGIFDMRSGGLVTALDEICHDVDHAGLEG